MTENLNNDEESRLIERLILGEEKAFCKLYVQYKPRLFKFAIALLKSQNVAEDICQDIFFNIWENRYFLKCGTSFSSFLFSMVVIELSIIYEMNRATNVFWKVFTSKR